MISYSKANTQVDANEMRQLIIASLSDIPEGTEKSYGKVAVEIAFQKEIINRDYIPYGQLPTEFRTEFDTVMRQLIATQKVRFLTDCETPEYGRFVRFGNIDFS